MIPFLNNLLAFIYWYVRPVIKGFLRRFTKLCELQRICYGEEKGAARTLKIESSLNQSRTPAVIDVTLQLSALAERGSFTEDSSRNAVEYGLKNITEVKNINVVIHRQFLMSFRTSLLQICGYQQLIHEVENLRKTQYSSSNKEHENKLLQLWILLKPDTALNGRVSKQWGDIGFQGDDPKTDFRGMGLLGLEDLLYFATNHTDAARHVLSHSHHPYYGYSFAIVGINLTSMAYHLLATKALKTHFFNFVQGRPQLEHFHYVYSYLFLEFDKFWLAEKPRDIMEFSRIRDKFNDKIELYLSNPKTVLRINHMPVIL